jgi:small subunit ribosomal protein S4
MRKIRKKYKTPTKGWSKERIERERETVKTYGLKKKREIWRSETFSRKFRRLARELAARTNKEKEKVLIEKLVRYGLLNEGNTLDDVLSLTTEKFLERRLQTILVRKGLCTTPKQARQMIVHGHVMINGRRISYPSYLVTKSEEDKIQMNIQIKKATI